LAFFSNISMRLAGAGAWLGLRPPGKKRDSSRKGDNER